MRPSRASGRGGRMPLEMRRKSRLDAAYGKRMGVRAGHGLAPSASGGRPRAAGSTGPAGAARRRATRSFAERARGFRASSAASGSIALRVTSAKRGVSAAVSGAWRLPRGAAPERSWRKRLTTRSSSEWKVTTASQPPGASARSAAARPRASSPSSSLTAMRSAWKLRVAGCGWPGFGRGSRRSIRPASWSVVAKGALAAVGDDGAGDAAGRALLAVLEENVGERRLGQAVDEVGGRGAGLAHPHVERAVLLEGEAAGGLVELHRGDADVEHDAVERRMARPRRRCGRGVPKVPARRSSRPANVAGPGGGARRAPRGRGRRRSPGRAGVEERRGRSRRRRRCRRARRRAPGRRPRGSAPSRTGRCGPTGAIIMIGPRGPSRRAPRRDPRRRRGRRASRRGSAMSAR